MDDVDNSFSVKMFFKKSLLLNRGRQNFNMFFASFWDVLSSSYDGFIIFEVLIVENNDMRTKLNKELQEEMHNVWACEKIHYEMAERRKKQATYIKIADIVLTAVSTAGFLGTVLTNTIALSWVGGIFSAIALGVNLYTKDFNLEKDSVDHKTAADELWKINAEYKCLLVDLDVLSDDKIREKRDKLIEESHAVYLKYPMTDIIGYKKYITIMNKK